MKNWRRWLSAALAALMVFSSCASFAETAAEGELTIEKIEAMGAKAYVHNGRVTFVEGACTDQPVQIGRASCRERV